MPTIRELFDPSRSIDRRIEKVITYDATVEDLLEQEIREYVATDSIQEHFGTLLDLLEEGMTSGNNPEVGVWVSGFYGSGKSSFTKYLGFALDPARTLRDRPFREWLYDRFTSKALRQRLNVVAKKCPAVVVMLDLASDQWAGASLAAISSILYAKIMQWAGYSRDEKIAYLEFMLERDGRLDAFKARIRDVSKGKEWEEIRNQPLATKALAAKVAVEFYPEFFPDTKAFNEIRIEERVKESDRVKEMLDLIERRTGHRNILFVLDEVGQYVAAREDLILNLDGLAKNIKNIGRGSAWIIATAQQTLTEDDPRAITNSTKLFKLKDRFPITIDLEASDIREICHRRLLTKSAEGLATLEALFDRHGPQCRHATDLKNTRFYRADLTKETFCRFYPFLPQHFDILLQLLARLARTRGGVGLRSAIKVIQDILTDPGSARESQARLAEAEAGTLATAAMFYETLREDIRKPMPHIIDGVEKAARVFESEPFTVDVAKAIGVLQVLEDFPVSRENIAALVHPSIAAPSCLDRVAAAVDALLREPSVPVSEIDGSLRFMSAAVIDLDKERGRIQPTTAEMRKIVNTAIREIFTPLPDAKLDGARQIRTGIKVAAGSLAVSVSGEKETIQTIVELVPEKRMEQVRLERIADSQQRSSDRSVWLIGYEDPAIESLALDIHRSQTIYSQYRNKTNDKDVEEYLRAQQQRADALTAELARIMTGALAKGSFVFRGTPKAVGALSPDLLEASCRHMADVARRVYEKYPEAPVQAPSNAAENFLRTEQLQKIASKDDPLGLVNRKGSGATIDVDHAALLSVRNFLEHHGLVDGRRLLDEFFEPPYGWSKDTTRYIIAVLLTAGVVKLRVAGADITTRAGDAALNSLRNTNAFNRISVALRNSAPPLEALLRAKDRLLTLTGDEISPLEEDISRCVIRHFPDYQQEYAPLRTRLETLGLPGVERAQNIQDNISEILKGDASDAAGRLGNDACPFFDDLLWARAVSLAFENGLGEVASEARTLLKEIADLPPDGPPGALARDSEELRRELAGCLDREDFHAILPEMRQKVTELRAMAAGHAKAFLETETAWLDEQKTEVRAMPEWNRLGTDDKGRLGAGLEALLPVATPDLAGIRKLLNGHYSLDQKIKRIRDDVRRQAAPAEPTHAPDDTGAATGSSYPGPDTHPGPQHPAPSKTADPAVPLKPPAPKRIKAPRAITTIKDLDALLDLLQRARPHLEAGGTIQLTAE
ncbi:MAG TPA: BREX system P-loop protein BrxC [Candidatus Ozemobacteraceae bacterium]|nr:BREX system P-loop protein BrxC [Candidatus Ozemobacteraceae bacterium]